MYTFQYVTRDDANTVAAIVVAANSGLVELLFDGLIPGLNSAAILGAAFIQGEDPYNTRNVICSHEGERLTSLLFAYPATEHKVPVLLESFIPTKRLAPIRPILEKSVPNSLYINTMWLEESLRGNGHTTALLLEAESLCRMKGLHSLSLFCWNDNTEAMRFWTQLGFSIAEHLEQQTIPVAGHDKGGCVLYKTIKDC